MNTKQVDYSIRIGADRETRFCTDQYAPDRASAQNISSVAGALLEADEVKPAYHEGPFGYLTELYFEERDVHSVARVLAEVSAYPIVMEIYETAGETTGKFVLSEGAVMWTLHQVGVYRRQLRKAFLARHVGAKFCDKELVWNIRICLK